MLGGWKGRQILPLVVGALLGAQPGLAQDISWGYNSYGTPGLIDMPGAHSRPDAELGLALSHFRNQTRYGLTFQISDRLSASFRYAMLYDIRPQPGDAVVDYRFDRSFSVHYRIADESAFRPALAIGINDIVGTGVYGGEYLVASKTLTPRLRASLGLGWGRLGSYNGFTNPLGVFGQRFETRPAHGDGLGGSFEPENWFRGDAAFFGGVEWWANDRLRLVAEYSSDDYAREDGSAFDWKSPLNLGVDYQYTDRATLSARYLYGSELGVQLTYAFNPKRSSFGSGLEKAPPPVMRRSEIVNLPGRGDLAPVRVRDALAAEGLVLEGLSLDGRVLRVQLRNDRYGIAAQALGRAARVMTRLAPAPVETFEITLAEHGMPITRATVRRTDMEELEFHPVAPDLSRARTRISDAVAGMPPLALVYPIFNWGVEPYLLPSLFDPDDPLRLDVGAAAAARYEPLPGVVLSGRVHQKLIGNLDKGTRPSTSVLPHVRSDAYLYYKGGDTTIPELTAAYYFRPAPDLFGRVTLGYLESMFGGASAEILWKPQNSRLAFGAEINRVKQRDFDQLFGFQDYEVTTGHLSTYAEMGGGYTGQLDVGRYLARDLGATLTLAREFDNGWKVAAFATLTDVSAEDFGEGSFDKGISVTMPLDWLTGQPDRRRLTTVIRPVQRDGGARVNVTGRLYDTVRSMQATELDASWGRFWR